MTPVWVVLSLAPLSGCYRAPATIGLSASLVQLSPYRFGQMLNRPSRRRLIQQETNSAHRAVEAVVGRLNSRAQYARYVIGLHAFRTPLEASLHNIDWHAAFGEWRPVEIAPLLACDLSDLGLNPTRPAAPPAITNDVAELVGCLYVLEGSTLGARILRMKAQELGFGDNFGAQHLAQQANTSDNWLRFLEILEGMDRFDLDQAVRSATATFGAALEAFRGVSDGDV